MNTDGNAIGILTYKLEEPKAEPHTLLIGGLPFYLNYSQPLPGGLGTTYFNIITCVCLLK